MAQPRVGFSSGGSSGSSKKHLTAEPSSSTGPPPSPTPTARLEAAQHLLGCIAARHRNQLGRAGGGGCGGTGWWRALGQLRTAIRRLLVVQRKVLEQRPGRGQVRRRLGDVPKTKERPEERKRLAQKRRRRADDPVPVPGAQGDAVPGGGDAAVEVHARWLRDVLVPRCYAIFSRLVADQQFAGQGIVLLGIVADVAAAVTALAPVPVAGQVASAGEHGSLIGETVVTNEARNASVAAEVVVPTTGPPGVAPVSSSVGSSVPRDDDGDWELGVPLSRAELEELRQGVVSQDKPTKRRGEVVSKSLTAAAQRKKKR